MGQAAYLPQLRNEQRPCDRRTKATVTLAVELRALDRFVPVVLLFRDVDLVAIEPPLVEPPR